MGIDVGSCKFNFRRLQVADVSANTDRECVHVPQGGLLMGVAGNGRRNFSDFQQLGFD